ncbi:hypothetical protein XC62_09230 [Klebsiella pneumoniae]|nr:hypothetical protein [Klebsiella pneumoniae]
MNDASGLVSLKFAVAVAMGTMVFTVGGAILSEPATQIVLLFLLPFASYLIAAFRRDAHRALARQQHLGNVGVCLQRHGLRAS